MKPLLLPKDNPNLSSLQYPVLVSPKLDGIRCLTTVNGPVSRTLKPIPNKYIHEQLSRLPAGLDGELILGSPTDPDVYRKTNSAVMSHEGTPNFTYYVFDVWSSDDIFSVRSNPRWKTLYQTPPFVTALSHDYCNSPQEVEFWFDHFLKQGYEGLIIRNPKAYYKFGRCTTKENIAYKFKPYADDEAVIVACEPEYENTNEAITNELGRTSRSTAAAGLIPKESLGSITVTNETWGYFNIGTGWTKEERESLWNLHKNKNRLIGKVVKFKYFPVGIKDKPRHPVFLGFRNMEIDG
jgi:DNA ligase-1